jgi:hypothetical protein
MTNRDTHDILAYEEEQKQLSRGINIQINTLIDAMVDAEKCLFHNREENLMRVEEIEGPTTGDNTKKIELEVEKATGKGKKT